MEKLSLETVQNAERQAVAMGAASTEGLKKTAEKWLIEHKLKQLTFEDGVAEAIERITNLPR